ncbi:ADP-ribose pyrophosphatase [Deinobacterium chartae]|uniref:ADP-ribose pyrophosphatase n=1 Tax=Deinobacterium chartae TaxID=521158 RepID=A0A841HX66_9DEIO|nr:NUDIX hydrolase [Deinobacterium chartae]MBB6097997.1 ADP-ribose pyrophosphatase [Deinobacterium chartae]
MTETLYEGKILRLQRLDARWEVIDHADAVAILALRDSQMLVVRQYRPAIGKHTLEAPAGLIDPGETPLEAALRELSEEANLGGHLELLTRFYPSPGFSNEEVYLFEATDLFEKPGTPDEDEELEVLWMRPQHVLEALRSGEVAGSASTITAALFALQRLQDPA